MAGLRGGMPSQGLTSGARRGDLLTTRSMAYGATPPPLVEVLPAAGRFQPWTGYHLDSYPRFAAPSGSHYRLPMP